MVGTRTGRTKALTVFFVVALACALLASAAVAQEAGEGEGGGKMFYSVATAPSPSGSSCAQVTSFSGTSSAPGGNYSGTYSATNLASGATVSYSGPLNVTVNALETYYSSRLGTFSDSGCLIPDPVLVNSTVSGTSGTVTVSCEYSGNMTHRRPKGIIDDHDSLEILTELAGDCRLTDTAPEPDVSILINAAEVRNGDIVKCSGPTGSKSCRSNERFRAALADED